MVVNSCAQLVGWLKKYLDTTSMQIGITIPNIPQDTVRPDHLLRLSINKRTPSIRRIAFRIFENPGFVEYSIPYDSFLLRGMTTELSHALPPRRKDAFGDLQTSLFSS